MTSVLKRVLPPSIAYFSSFGDHTGPPTYAEEELVIRNSVPERQREFRTARHCARLALAQLGRPAVPLLPGHRGAVRWPDGVTGSLTHCPGYRAAAVTETDRFRAVGIDAEPHQPLPGGTLRIVTLPAERAMLAALTAAEPDVHWDRLLFCAKEAVYKAWFPLTGAWLGFDGARLTFTPDSRRFRARLLVTAPVVDGRTVDEFSGWWTVGQGLVVAAVAVPAESAD